MEKEIIIIAALAQNLVIGRGEEIPWRLPDDMKFFADTTKGHTVIMGRKTWETIPLKYKPLPERRNIVLTNSLSSIHGADVFTDLQSAIDSSTGKIFIIGGGEIYKQALPLASKLILTEVNADVQGDIFFPTFDTLKYNEVSRVFHPTDEKHKISFDFVTYEKK